MAVVRGSIGVEIRRAPVPTRQLWRGAITATLAFHVIWSGTCLTSLAATMVGDVFPTLVEPEVISWIPLMAFVFFTGLGTYMAYEGHGLSPPSRIQDPLLLTLTGEYLGLNGERHPWGAIRTVDVVEGGVSLTRDGGAPVLVRLAGYPEATVAWLGELLRASVQAHGGDVERVPIPRELHRVLDR